MGKVSKKINIKLWQGNAAKEYTSDLMKPHRPSEGELAIYDRLLEKIKKKTSGREALILGSTPTLRDLLSKHSFHTTIVDVNKNMIDAMEILLKQKEKNPVKIESNWLDIDFPPDSFDVILGDHSFSNIVPFKKWPHLAQALQTITKKDGFLIQNIVVQPGEPELLFDDLISFYRQNNAIFQNPCEKWYYIYQVVMSDPKFYQNNFSNWGAFDELLENYLKDKKINNREFEDLRVGIGKCTFSMPPKKVVDKTLEKYFTILSANFSKEYELHKFYCIYHMKPKYIE